MAVNLSPLGGVGAQFFDSNGNPLSGGLIYTYAAGTNTPQATYTTSAGSIQHSNPIVLDAAGRVPTGEIWLTDGISYKFVIQTSAAVLVGTYDNIVGINSNFIAYTSQQEIQTATAGQTVFTLATMQYQPNTNNLSVFVDGVNQYGPGAQYAFVETDATTVTFVSGLHVGASVKFTTASPVSSNYANAAQVTYDPPFTGAVATNVEAKLSESVSVKDFGAVGDGIVDDTTAIQTAINGLNGSGALYFPKGTYLISDTLSFTANGSFVVYGDGATATEIYAKAPTGTSESDLYHALSFTGTGNVHVRDMSVKGERDSVNVTVYTNGSGVGAFRFDVTGQGVAENLYVSDWVGTGFKAGYDFTFISCVANKCGRPDSSPGTEYGDGFYASGASTVTYINCHYTGSLVGGTTWTTRGGFVVNSPSNDAKVSYLNCSSVNANRAIHFEVIPYKATIDGFYGEKSAIGLICWNGVNACFIDIKNARFKDCGALTSGVLFTGECAGLRLTAENVYTQDLIGAFYRHHQGPGPVLAHFKTCRTTQSSTTEFFALYNATSTEMTTDFYYDGCEFPYGKFITTRIKNINANHTVFAYLYGGVSGSNRIYRFNGCTLGRTVAETYCVYGSLYANVYFEDCVFEYNSVGTAFLFDTFAQTNAYIKNPIILILNAAPTTLNKTGVSGNIIVEPTPYLTSVTNAPYWQLKNVSAGGSVNVMYGIYGDLRTYVPTGYSNYQVGRLIVDGNYLWVDGSGKLRIKSSAPSSDTDGTVVGTQT